MVNAQICFSTNTFILFFIFNIVVIGWSLYNIYKTEVENAVLKTNIENYSTADKQNTKITTDINIDTVDQIDVEPRYGLPINIPTRGEPSDFYVVGYIYRKKNPDQTMKLLERYLYSNRYEYCTLHHNDPSIKIPVYTHNYEQLSDGDAVHVQGYRGKFRVTIYPIDLPRAIYK